MTNNGNEDEAKDIYQDSVIVFYENVRDGKFKGESAISTYLYAVAKFKWLNQLKRKGMKASHHEQISQNREFEQSPLLALIDQEQKDQIMGILKQLGLQCKRLLIDSIYHNKSMKEIVSESEFSSEQIARNKKYKCMQKLKALLLEKPELVKILKAYD